jgi:hypothetical protein
LQCSMRGRKRVRKNDSWSSLPGSGVRLDPERFLGRPI